MLKKNKPVELKPIRDVNYDDYSCGVIVARFQVSQLHGGHLELIKTVEKNHEQLIIFLGVPNVTNTKRNPLDFYTRKLMLQVVAPNAIILPIKDNRSNMKWSENVDNLINITVGGKALLYGSRTSFLPYYMGKHETLELVTNLELSGSELRLEDSRKVLQTKDFRAGIIYNTHKLRPVPYPTVDVLGYYTNGDVILGKKENELKYRFIGGFVDVTDDSYEETVKREFIEETNGVISKLRYVTNLKVNDWRYKLESSKIITNFYIGEVVTSSNNLKADDDISELKKISFNELCVEYKNLLMPEHIKLMEILINKINSGEININALNILKNDK